MTEAKRQVGDFDAYVQDGQEKAMREKYEKSKAEYCVYGDEDKFMTFEEFCETERSPY